MKNIEYEVNLNLDLLKNFTGLDYKKDGLNLYLNGKLINKFLDFEDMARFLNIEYTKKLLEYTKENNK